MKKVILKSIIIFLITVFLFYYILKDNFNESIKLLSSSNLLFVLLGVLMCFIAFLVDTLVFKTLIKRHNKNYSNKKNLKFKMHWMAQQKTLDHRGKSE